MIGPEVIPFAMITQNGKLQISWATILQGLIVGLTAGAVASYVLLIRLDERIGYLANQQNDMAATISYIKSDFAERMSNSYEDRRRLSERISALEALQRQE